jgi:xanthine dehydrogenase YagT iron-sulfur-binding subunit
MIIGGSVSLHPEVRPRQAEHTMETRLRVNGADRTLQLPPQVSLLDALREHLGLTGTKKGCDQGACGACTVLADGERINSCLTLAVQYTGREITTIEGVTDGELQRAFVRHDGLQCGYCTSGQICSAIGMLAEHAAGMPSAVTEHHHGDTELTDTELSDTELTDAEIRERMSGNLCRCGAYNGIVDAIAEVAR